MKSLVAGLQAHLDTGATTLAWCWKVERRDGEKFGFTDHDRTLTFDGVDFEAATGFTASEIVSSLNLSIDNLEVESALSSDRIEDDDLTAGRWDDATVELWRVNWANTAQRVLMRKGSLGEVTRGSIAFRAEIRGLAHRLNQEQGRIFQRTCDAKFGDGRCKFDAATVTGSGSVDAVTANRIVSVSGLGAFAEGWFSFGELVWTSGANDGVKVEIRRHALTDGVVQLTLWQAAPLAIVEGDTFSIVAGCDKTFDTCKAKFANASNFRGFPHIPGNDQALSVAKQDDPANDGRSLFN